MILAVEIKEKKLGNRDREREGRDRERERTYSSPEFREGKCRK